MLTIPEDFFREEIRDDFTVPSLMKRAWAAELTLLDQLTDFFREHGLKYFAEVGTLLGAVRHGGFIPWDDDLDIGMPREDYMKLQELSAELPAPLRLKSFYTQEDFDQFHAVVSNSRSDRLEWDEERMAMYCGCPFIVGIDIFPFDLIPRDPKEKQLQRLLYNMAYVAALDYDTVYGAVRDSEKERKYESDLHTLERYCNVLFDYDSPIKPQLFRLADSIAMRCKRKAAWEYDYHPRLVIHEDPWLRRIEWYREFVTVPFECTEIVIPKDAEKILDRFYVNWRTPIQRPSEHGYPFYASQMEYFRLAGYEEAMAAL